MIYLQDNPLLREPLSATHIKQRLLGHWGSSPGLSFMYVHLNHLVHISDSMFNQHAKWLDIAEDIPWRAPVASLNLLITSTVWRQAHNGFTHQDPGFLDLAVNKSPRVTRIYLPPDANALLSVADHCLRSTDDVNVIVCDKQQHVQYLDTDAAIRHCTKGIGIWHWASNDQGSEPDVVMAACADIPTIACLNHAYRHGVDQPEMRDWRWPY